MINRQVQRTMVWSGWMRLAHWLIALPVIVLIATGWLLDQAPSVAESASRYHDLASVGLILGLLLRLWLLFFGKDSGHWKALMPARTDIPRIGAMLRFYATLGRTPIPKWYAHNPLWAPLYLVVVVILVVQALTGLLMESYPVIGGFYLPFVHDFWATVILVFACLHVIVVVLHDAKGTTSDVSAMINGHKIFVVEDVEGMRAPDVHSVSLDQIGKARSSND